ncbi:hypothetical protein GCM10022275_19330 [Tessaracoccus defluvii]
MAWMGSAAAGETDIIVPNRAAVAAVATARLTKGRWGGAGGAWGEAARWKRADGSDTGSPSVCIGKGATAPATAREPLRMCRGSYGLGPVQHRLTESAFRRAVGGSLARSRVMGKPFPRFPADGGLLLASGLKVFYGARETFQCPPPGGIRTLPATGTFLRRALDVDC